MGKPDPERWALSSNGRASVHTLTEGGGYGPKLVRVEKSFSAIDTHAVYMGINNVDDSGTMSLHLTADDAEGIATVLLFLADKWRKENT